MSDEPNKTAPAAPAAAAPGAANPGAATLGAPGAAAAPAAAGKPAGPALPMLIGIAVAGLIGGAALGLFLIAPRVVAARRAHPAVAASHEAEKPQGEKGRESKEGKDGKSKEGNRPPAYRMDNIIVNPAGSNGSRFLMLSVAIEVDDNKSAAAMKERDVELRDVVIETIERQTLADLTRPGARDSLRGQLCTALEAVIGWRPRIFLPQFVLQ